MTNTGTMHIRIDPYEYTNDIRVNLFGYRVLLCFLRDTLQNPSWDI